MEASSPQRDYQPSARRCRPGVYDLDDLRELPRPMLPHPWRTLVDEAGMLAQWCALDGVPWPSYAQRIGFSTHGATPTPAQAS
jgi:hypothetical protein